MEMKRRSLLLWVASATTALTLAQENEKSKRIPAYHDKPPESPQPRVIDAREIEGAENKLAYTLAAKIPVVLYQLPCFCNCDLVSKHKSLLDCYITAHAAGCPWCKQEAVFAYLQTKEGKSPAQVRDLIIEQKWKELDLHKYMYLLDEQGSQDGAKK